MEATSAGEGSGPVDKVEGRGQGSGRLNATPTNHSCSLAPCYTTAPTTRSTAHRTCEVGLRQHHVGDSCLEVDVGECPSLSFRRWFRPSALGLGPGLPARLLLPLHCAAATATATRTSAD